MKTYYTLLFTFLLLVQALAQGTSNLVTGQIRDMDSGLPLAGAVVTITFHQQPFSTVTDDNGNYTIKTNVQYAEDNFPIRVGLKGYYELNGFVRVKKESAFSFKIKKVPVKVEATKPAVTLEGLATNNWVFLLDVSSSMNAPDKLPLIQQGLKSIVELFRKDDQVALVAFSGAAKEILPTTNGMNKEKIFNAIDSIKPGGKSQGAAAVNAAYDVALKNYITNGNNRIIIATDGVFTSGEKDLKEIKKIIEKNLVKDIRCSVFIVGNPGEAVKTELQKIAETGKGHFSMISDATAAKQKMFEEAKASQ